MKCTPWRGINPNEKSEGSTGENAIDHQEIVKHIIGEAIVDESEKKINDDYQTDDNDR